jgi:4-hydroxybenzoyl-CoA reductase subunit beta
MHLDPFELHEPRSLPEAMALAQELEGSFDYLAGGTDLLPNYKMHLNNRPHLISLGRIPELSRYDSARGWFGALTPLRRLEGDARLAREFPGIAEGVRQIATPLVRSSATVGGNLLVETRCFFFNQSRPWREGLGYCLKAEGDRCHVVPQKERCYATFSGDLAPNLMVLGAEAELTGPTGTRRVPVRELYDRKGDGIHRTLLAPGEVVVGVQVPPEMRGVPATYRKLRVRPAFDFPELGVAAALRMDGGRVRLLRLATGGLETAPREFSELTDPLVGEELTAERIDALAQQVRSRVRPVHNTALAPDYRKRMAGVYVHRALTALQGAG